MAQRKHALPKRLISDVTGTLTFTSNASVIIDGDENDVLNVDMRHLIQMGGTVNLTGHTYDHYVFGATSILVERFADLQWR